MAPDPHFYIVQSFYKNFSRVKIPANPKRQEAAVARKLKLLRDLEKALKPIIRYDDGGADYRLPQSDRSSQSRDGKSHLSSSYPQGFG